MTGSYTADQPTTDLRDVLALSMNELGGTDVSILWQAQTAGGISEPVGVVRRATDGPMILQSWELGGFGGSIDGVVAEYLNILLPAPPLAFTRGDCNQDTITDIADAIFLLGELFGGAVMSTCPIACDANDDDMRDIADAVAILNYLFASAGPLPAPTFCGTDPTPGTLTCPAPGCP